MSVHFVSKTGSRKCQESYVFRPCYLLFFLLHQSYSSSGEGSSLLGTLLKFQEIFNRTHGPPEPEYLIAPSQLTERGPLVRSHSIFKEKIGKSCSFHNGKRLRTQRHIQEAITSDRCWSLRSRMLTSPENPMFPESVYWAGISRAQKPDITNKKLQPWFNSLCCVIIHLPCTETSPAWCFRKTWSCFQHTGKQETVICQLYARGTLPVPRTVVEK